MLGTREGRVQAVASSGQWRNWAPWLLAKLARGVREEEPSAGERTPPLPA